MSQREVLLVKLGGSLITDKNRSEHARRKRIARIARELRAAFDELDARVIVGHGSGSFGHAAARRAGLRGGGRAEGALNALGVCETQGAAQRLHRIVAEKCVERGVPVFSLKPSSLLRSRQGRVHLTSVKPLLTALDHGFVPLTLGDVVLDDELGAVIASTEVVLETVARALLTHEWRIRRVLWLGETNGVRNERGRRIERIDEETFRVAQAASVGSAATIDVTGGMRLRLEAAWRLASRGIDSWILDGRGHDAVYDALVAPPGSVPTTGTLVRREP